MSSTLNCDPPDGKIGLGPAELRPKLTAKLKLFEIPSLKSKADIEFECNLSDLLDLCAENKFEVDLPGLSRLVKKLVDQGYMAERREGREKYLKLTDLGLIFCPVEENVADIKIKLNNTISK